MVLEAFQLNGKNALVTGSSRGLGAAIALALAQAGANVGCHGRSADGNGSSEQIRQLGRKSFYVAGNMSDPELGSALIRKVNEEFGSIDILVNNAGTIRRAAAAEFPQRDWDELIAVNLTAVFRLSQLAGHDMLRRGAKGKIVNIEDMKPQTLDSHCNKPKTQVRYALEMNLGWFKQKNIKPGTVIDGLPRTQ